MLWKRKPVLRVVNGGMSALVTPATPALDAEIAKMLAEDRALISRFISNTRHMIFGRRQAEAIRAFVMSWFTRTQVELTGPHVASALAIGFAGSGKTALADAIGHKFVDGDRRLYNKITAYDDIMPSHLFGHMELVRGEDGEYRQVHRPGYLVPDVPIITFDEFPRFGAAAQNGAAPVFSEGEFVLGDFRKRIAREGEPLILMATANPPGATGTHTPGQFMVDRIAAARIFRTEWQNPAYMKMLISADDHWDRVREAGYHLPLLAPKDVTGMYERLRSHTKTEDATLECMLRLVQAFLTLTEPRWADSPYFRGKPVPARWFAPSKRTWGNWRRGGRGTVPDAPLVRTISDSNLKDPLAREPGGRMCQHLKMLAQADSFYTYGSPRTILPAIQEMAKAVFTSRVVWGMAEGGQEILYSRYDGDILQYTEDVVDWLIRSVDLTE